jgi:hypothetical protein
MWIRIHNTAPLLPPPPNNEGRNPIDKCRCILLQVNFEKNRVLDYNSTICIFFNLRLDAGLHARHLSTHAQQQLKQLARSRALPVDPSHEESIFTSF